MPRKTAWSAMPWSASATAFLVSVDPRWRRSLSQTLGSLEKKRMHRPNWATQELRTETEKSAAIARLFRADSGGSQAPDRTAGVDPKAEARRIVDSRLADRIFLV
jgi:hypothetical protein